MAAGDNTRAWWPQMLDEIEQRWSPELDWTACIKLSEEMTELRIALTPDGCKLRIENSRSLTISKNSQIDTLRRIPFLLAVLDRMRKTEIPLAPHAEP